MNNKKKVDEIFVKSLSRKHSSMKSQFIEQGQMWILWIFEKFVSVELEKSLKQFMKICWILSIFKNLAQKMTKKVLN